MTTPQQNAQNARLEQIKRSWQQKRQIGERLGKIKTKIGVYSGKGGGRQDHSLPSTWRSRWPRKAPASAYWTLT